MSFLENPKAFYFCNQVDIACAIGDVLLSFFNMAEGGFDEKSASNISGKIARITICSTLLIWPKFAACLERIHSCLKIPKYYLNFMNLYAIGLRSCIDNFDEKNVGSEIPSKTKVSGNDSYKQYCLFSNPVICLYIIVLLKHALYFRNKYCLK